ncbi:S1C family serine protease [Bradyrhizobium sp. 195]|uniref:S1C family serine protease n=1 Tax=Bradyrhizobium sp. 195 TaxID=2782662 RepID=UPI0020010AD5|nr:serine protease [Bradyrhizobium sp. 195]UPK27242.1 serine protease [Bradyrhizobium sp. 195]
MWLKSFVVAFVFQAMLAGLAHAAGPFGTIHVGNWNGGAYTNDSTGAFSHCAASTPYANGMTLLVGQDSNNAWLLGFANPAFRFKKGENLTIDVTFDGQAEVRLFATAFSDVMVSAVLPTNVARAFQKASLMVAVARGTPFQFSLTSTAPLIVAVTNCVTRVKADGLDKAGDFTKVAAKPALVGDKQGAPPTKPGRTGTFTGTGFVVSPNGHIVTNSHVIDSCTGDIKGNLAGETAMVLRVVSSDATNDLALLQAPATAAFKDFAKIRDRSMHSGDSVVAIGFPLHGYLSSDLTVTTGIVSSLSGFRNHTGRLQISAAVQAGNSGGPLFDLSGQVAGVVVAKLNALRMIKETGQLTENINFAIKTGALRDFLDNSVVPYQTAEPKGELKTTDIATNARAYTMLISCTGTEQADAKR